MKSMRCVDFEIFRSKSLCPNTRCDIRSTIIVTQSVRRLVCRCLQHSFWKQAVLIAQCIQLRFVIFPNFQVHHVVLKCSEIIGFYVYTLTFDQTWHETLSVFLDSPLTSPLFYLRFGADQSSPTPALPLTMSTIWPPSSRGKTCCYRIVKEVKMEGPIMEMFQHLPHLIFMCWSFC